MAIYGTLIFDHSGMGLATTTIFYEDVLRNVWIYKLCDLTWRRRGGAGVRNNVSNTTNPRPLLFARVCRLVPVEFPAGHQVPPVDAVADGFTDYELVTVGCVLQP